MSRRAPGSPGVPTPTLRPPLASETTAVQAIWEQSSVADDPGSPARGGWSVDAWATHQCALLLGDRVVGVTAIRAEPQATATAARIALAVDHRHPALAAQRVQAMVDMARKS